MTELHKVVSQARDALCDQIAKAVAPILERVAKEIDAEADNHEKIEQKAASKFDVQHVASTTVHALREKAKRIRSQADNLARHRLQNNAGPRGLLAEWVTV